jgi:excisionase family DNA binding protein
VKQIVEALQALTDRIARLEKAAKAPARTAWTAHEVAEQIGVPYRTVLAELIHTGELASVKAGRHYIVPDEALQAYLARAKQAA